MTTPGQLPQSQGIATDQPSTGQTQALTSQASGLLAKVSKPQLYLTRYLIPVHAASVCERYFHQPQMCLFHLHVANSAFQELGHPFALRNYVVQFPCHPG